MSLRRKRRKKKWRGGNWASERAASEQQQQLQQRSVIKMRGTEGHSTWLEWEWGGGEEQADINAQCPTHVFFISLDLDQFHAKIQQQKKGLLEWLPERRLTTIETIDHRLCTHTHTHENEPLMSPKASPPLRYYPHIAYTSNENTTRKNQQRNKTRREVID